MDTTQVALLAVALGGIVGAGVALLVVVSFRARDRALVETSTDLPDGVQSVLHAMDDAAIVVDTSSTIVAASAHAVVFDLQIGGVLATDELRSLTRAAREAEAPVAEKLRLRRGLPMAEPRLVVARASVISPRLVLVVFRDITERERVEEMRRDFVANTSHELKTPVGAVSLLAEAIEMAADDPAQVRNFAGRISAEAARLAALTGRIMSLSRLQSADEPADMREVSIDEVVASAVDAHAVAAQAAGVELQRGGVRGLFVRGDVQVLSEAVGNLIANAIAYSPAGSPVGVGVNAAAGVVEIVVTDRGIGIAESEQHRVFERFYRADQARSRRTGGTGLGLSIVKHAAQRHDGEVKLWSRPGRGSTFTLRLPRIDAPEILEVPKAKRKRSAGVKKAKKKAARLNGDSA